MKKKIKLDDLQEIARQLTAVELENYVIPELYRNNLTLGVAFEGDKRIFELYVAGEKPSDAIVISRATIDIYTGEGAVEVIGLERKSAI